MQRKLNGADLAENFFLQMSTRRSIREFSPEPVERQILLNAIKTAGTAPSGANKQPWHFALITNPELKQKIRAAAEQVEQAFYSGKAGETWLNDLKPFATNSTKEYLSVAPVLIAVFARTALANSDQKERTYYPVESTCIATGLLIASLHTSGLATLTHTPKPMNFLNSLLSLDATYRPLFIVVAGHPKTPTRVPNIERKSLDEILSEHT